MSLVPRGSFRGDGVSGYPGELGGAVSVPVVHRKIKVAEVDPSTGPPRVDRGKAAARTDARPFLPGVLDSPRPRGPRHISTQDSLCPVEDTGTGLGEFRRHLWSVYSQ